MNINKVSSYRQRTGKTGENYAEKFLVACGYTPLAHNIRTREGEIDLVFLDYSSSYPSGHPEIVFVEVKARKSTSFGTPAEAITSRKIEKILKVIFKLGKTFSQSSHWRLDALSVQLDQGGKILDITHFKNILNG